MNQIDEMHIARIGKGKCDNQPCNIHKPKVKLIGRDGNAFAIIGAVAKALRDAGAKPDRITVVRAEMMAGDYDNLLQVAGKYCEIS